MLLAAVGAVYIYITVTFSGQYFDQVNQRLNHDTAYNIVKNSTPFYNGEVIKPAWEELFHSVMVINPSLEVYLLDPQGNILAWYPPEKEISLKRINLEPIIQFINDSTNQTIRGDDPLNPATQKVFSASPLYMNDMLYAYVYVVLSGQEYYAASSSLFANYLLQIGTRTMLVTLLVTLLIGLFIIRIITSNFSRIVEVMQKFREGDLSARVNVQSAGDVKELGVMFNDMADILTQNIEKLKEVENLRRELIANVSHDLRTPIAIIRGYTETLQMKEDSISDEKRRHYINTVSDSAEKLDRLVNELFELSKLEANQVEAKKEPFIISELVGDICNKYQLIAKTKNITITTELSKELPPVYADISLIERVIQNLIDNALKFTPDGGNINIKTYKSDERIVVSVTDTGIGIPEAEREQIFARYYRANNFTDLKNSTGLGLAIAKKILDLHNSTLDLTSIENKGSSFSFKLRVFKSIKPES